MKLNIGNLLRNKNNRKLYKILDIFYYKDTKFKGYIIKDIWDKYSEPIMVSEEKINLEYEI